MEAPPASQCHRTGRIKIRLAANRGSRLISILPTPRLRSLKLSGGGPCGRKVRCLKHPHQAAI